MKLASMEDHMHLHLGTYVHTKACIYIYAWDYTCILRTKGRAVQFDNGEVKRLLRHLVVSKTLLDEQSRRNRWHWMGCDWNAEVIRLRPQLMMIMMICSTRFTSFQHLSHKSIQNVTNEVNYQLVTDLQSMEKLRMFLSLNNEDVYIRF